MERAEKKNDRFEHKTEQDPTFVYGKNAVTELLKSGAAVDTVFVQDTMNAAQAGYYTAIAREAGAVVKRVHAAKLRGMCGTEGHQGVAAWAASVDYVSLDDLLAEAARRGEPPFLLLADGVEDPHNLGAIIRTALLCGAHGVVIPRRGGKAARGAWGQHRRGCPQAEGAECICLLRGHGRTPRFPAKPYRPHCVGGGQ